MKILGIDPGSRITGYGLIEKEGNRLRHLDNGAIFSRPDAPLATRLANIYAGLGEIIQRHAPQALAVEQVFVARNARSAIILGQARGAALLAGVHGNLEIVEYTPAQIKNAVVGYGRASKEQVQQMVKALLNLPEIAQEDASDALAAAICHAHSATLHKTLALIGRGRRRSPG